MSMQEISFKTKVLNAIQNYRLKPSKLVSQWTSTYRAPVIIDYHNKKAVDLEQIDIQFYKSRPNVLHLGYDDYLQFKSYLVFNGHYEDLQTMNKIHFCGLEVRKTMMRKYFKVSHCKHLRK